jgi:hypothetical protein
MRGLNKTFYHQTVTSKQVEEYISKQAKFNYSKVFDQYLRTIQVPKLEFYLSDNNKKAHYRWTNVVKGFNLPLVLINNNARLKISPTGEWRSTDLKGDEATLFDPASIQKMYYITAVAGKG